MIEIKEYIPQIVATGILIVFLPLSKYVANKVVINYGKLTKKAESRMVHIQHVISILINITFVFMLAITWGVQPHNILIALSSIFAVIGVAMFAQWSLLSNITAGIIIFFSAPYRIGDRIHIMDKDYPIVATIEDIRSFYTYIRTDDEQLIVLPNNLFLQKVVAFTNEEE